MARHRKFESGAEADPALDISSLIDVCFLLLIYFLVATTIQKKEVDVPMALPSAAPSEDRPDIDPLFIRLDANGTVYVGAGGNQMMLDTDASIRQLPKLSAELEIYVAGAKSGGSNPLVQVMVDGANNQQRVIDVLNCLGFHGIKSITFTDLLD